NVTNQYVIGRFGEGASSEVGFMTSSIYTTQLSDALTHVLWIDYLDTDTAVDRAVERETLDITNYLLVSLSDNLTWGNRLEWYNIDDQMGGKNDIYQFTTGLNIGMGENLLFRPELRWDWDKDGVIGNELGQSQTTVGGDMVLTF
ncbi:MAG: outer membrane beta-barrel protein, partial [Pirellulaceae bacterium]